MLLNFCQHFARKHVITTSHAFLYVCHIRHFYFNGKRSRYWTTCSNEKINKPITNSSFQFTLAWRWFLFTYHSHFFCFSSNLPFRATSFAQISGKECKNTSPSNPPTAKLSSVFKILALSETKKYIMYLKHHYVVKN